MQEKQKRLAKNTIIFVVGSLGSKFIQFFLVPFYTYAMSTAEYGSADIVITMSDVLMPVFSLSIADGLLRFGLDKKLKQEDVLKCCFIIDNIGTLSSIACIPLFRLYSGLSQWIASFLLILTLRIYRDFFSINLKINDKNRLFAIDSILYTLVLCICSILFLSVMKMGTQGYLLSYIMANTFSILFLSIVGKTLQEIHRGRLDKKLFEQIVKYSIPMVANAMAWWIITASDRLMVQHYMGNDAVGLYAVATKMPSIVSTFSGVFLQAWTISSVTEYDSDRDAAFYGQVFDEYYSVMLFAASALITVIRPFMHLYVSPAFQSAWIYTPLLISSAVFSGLFGFYAGIYAAAKNSINVTITTAIGAVCNVFLNFLMIPRIGIQGAVIATYISWMTTTFIRMFDTKKFVNFTINYRKLLVMVLINLIQGICTIKLAVLPATVISVIVLAIMYFMNKKTINSMFRMIEHKLKKD